MKTLKVSDEVWTSLMQMKLDSKAKNMDNLLKELIASHRASFK